MRHCCAMLPSSGQNEQLEVSQVWCDFLFNSLQFNSTKQLSYTTGSEEMVFRKQTNAVNMKRDLKQNMSNSSEVDVLVRFELTNKELDFAINVQTLKT